ncbi:MAG: ABC transporter ATP-binding protein [Polyangiaceae bacterium]|nr:ABC transporter ATP-binding protein [Polyangiaceae bacterium]
MAERAGAGADADAPAVRLHEVSFDYPDGTVGLAGVSLEVGREESLAVVGPNGAGKSTLALLLPGLLVPARGSIEVCGLPVGRRTLTEVRRRLGLVLESPDDQLFLGTLLEDVAFGPLNHGASPEEARARALAALDAVGLADAAARFPGHLSSGQKRAAALATVLAMRPEVFVMDEPTANLDPRARRAVLALILRLPGARIVVTHDLEAALDCCARTALFDGGRLVAAGPTAELLADGELLAAHGLDKPHSLLTPEEHAAMHQRRRAH